MTTPWLSDWEIDDLCAGLRRNSAKVRYLRDVLKLPVKTKPNGRPLVTRTAFQDILSGIPLDQRRTGAIPQRTPVQPDESALLRALSRRSR